jgi:hypothetical protein
MSQTYLLPCSCGQNIRVGTAQAGGKVTCVCGQSLSVPTLRGLRQLVEAPPESRKRAAAPWGPVQRTLFAVGLLTAGVGIFLISIFSLQYTRIQHSQIGGKGLTVDRSAEVTSAMAGEIDKLTPAQALDMWTGEIKTEGLGEAHKPIWVAAKDKLAEYTRWLKLGGALVAGGLVLSLATLFVKRRS